MQECRRQADLLRNDEQKADNICAEECNVLVLPHHQLVLCKPLPHITYDLRRVALSLVALLLWLMPPALLRLLRLLRASA